jgi:ParB family transcriptional regulator, chromosome partitioning protein
MTRKGGLGRGLDALIPGGDRPLSGVAQIPVHNIAPNPRQPRSSFNPEELAELAASIKQHGVLQPLIVSPGEDTDRYVLIAGERRLLAARLAHLETVPVLVRQASEQQLLELALIENLQRADLSPLEAGEAYHQLADEFDLSHEEIAARVGKSRVVVTNTLRLLRLPDDVRQALSERKISEGHARALLGLSTPQAQSAALQTILSNDYTVRQTEELVRRLSGEKPPPAGKPALPPEEADLQQRLETALGTRVKLNRRKGKGTLVIHFYSDEELEALVLKLT